MGMGAGHGGGSRHGDGRNRRGDGSRLISNYFFLFFPGTGSSMHKNYKKIIVNVHTGFMHTTHVVRCTTCHVFFILVIVFFISASCVRSSLQFLIGATTCSSQFQINCDHDSMF